MIDPAADLHADIALLDEALEPFTAPQVDERPGLRWMRQTLVDRRRHIWEKIEEAERSTLRIGVRSVTGSADLPATTVSDVLEAVQGALHVAGGAVQWPAGLTDGQRDAALVLEVGVAELDDEWSIELHRPRGPLAGQPMVASGESLAFDAAVARMLDGIDAGDATGLEELVLAQGLSIHLTASLVTVDDRHCRIDRHTVAAG